MELTGRTYIFVGATLLLLAGSLRLYSEVAEGSPDTLTTFGAGVAACDAKSIELGDRRLGCTRAGDVRVRDFTRSSGSTLGGGSTFGRSGS